MDEATVNVYEAKTHLSRLLREVAAGHEFIIARDGVPVARLIPVKPPGGRLLGSAIGTMRISDDFDAPLPADVAIGFGAALP